MILASSSQTLRVWPLQLPGFSRPSHAARSFHCHGLIKQKFPRLLAMITGCAILHRWPFTRIARINEGYLDRRSVLGHWEAIGLTEAGKKAATGGIFCSTTRSATQTWTTCLAATTTKVLGKTILKLCHMGGGRCKGPVVNEETPEPWRSEGIPTES